MNIIITGRKVELGEALKTKVEKKLLKLDKFFNKDASTNVTISKEKERETVEVTVYQGSLIFRAQSTTKDIMDSLNDVVDALEKQILKNKTRLEKKLREGVFDQLEASVKKSEEEEEKEFNVAKVKTFPIKPMTTEEAILQMNLLQHQFFVFKNIF
jgi:putative sigma-54 modulation protein